MRPRWQAALLLAVLTITVLAGCSGNDEPPVAASSPATEDGGTAEPEPDPAGADDGGATEDGDAGESGGGLSRDSSGGSGSSLSRGGGVEATPLERRALELFTALDAGQGPAGAVIELSDAILFDFDEAVLKPEAADVLDDLAELAELTDEVPVLVTGHTDGRGTDAYNLDLSMRRAEAVVAALEDRGVDPSRLSADGVGSQEPILEEGGPDDEQARARNRRVEVVFEGVDLDQ